LAAGFDEGVARWTTASPAPGTLRSKMSLCSFSSSAGKQSSSSRKAPGWIVTDAIAWVVNGY
jgi:hypothetical protein